MGSINPMMEENTEDRELPAMHAVQGTKRK